MFLAYLSEMTVATPCVLRRLSMQQQIIDLYDSYTHGGMSRRIFLDRLAVLAGGTAAATPTPCPREIRASKRRL